MTISKIAVKDVITITKEANIIAAAKLMREKKVGDVIVVQKDEEGHVPIGILTDRDIVVAIIAEDVKLEDVSVGDTMSYELLIVHENQGIWEVLQMMSAKKVRRAPIVDEKGYLVSVVSIDDLLRLLADEINQVAKIIA
jgi:CBS domain-containing protein